MTAPAHDSVSLYLARFRAGDSAAVGPLWDRYFLPLLRRAEGRLPPGGDADAEDAALSAFKTFWRAVARGRFPDLDDDGELWRILVVLLDRKVSDYMRRRSAREDMGTAGTDPNALATNEPDPLVAAVTDDEFRRLLAALDTDELRRIALWKLEGYRHEEIAGFLNCVPRTVVNKVNLIRKVWKRELPT